MKTYHPSELEFYEFYHVESQKSFDTLVEELIEKGADWQFGNFWHIRKEDTLIVIDPDDYTIYMESYMDMYNRYGATMNMVQIKTDNKKKLYDISFRAEATGFIKIEAINRNEAEQIFYDLIEKEKIKIEYDCLNLDIRQSR